MRAREIAIQDVPCLALRVTYVGELGWELYPPMEFGTRLWDVLFEAGQPHGLVPAGYRAIESMRLEGGFLAWAADITPEDNPYEAGLDFAVKLDKSVPFIGKEALEKVKAQGSAASAELSGTRRPRHGRPRQRTRQVELQRGRLPGNIRRERLFSEQEHRVRPPSHRTRRVWYGALGRGIWRGDTGRGSFDAALGSQA